MRLAGVVAAGLCLVGLSAAPALAQARNLEAGVEAAIDFSNISPAPSSTSGIGAGALFGVYAVFPVWSVIAIQPEIVYMQKHSHLNSVADANLDYIEIPVLAKMRLFESFYMTEGVSLGFPIKAEIVPNPGAAVDVKDHTTSPDVGIVIGGGVPFRNFGVEFRYEGGIRRIDTTTGASEQRTRSFMLLGRVHF